MNVFIFNNKQHKILYTKKYTRNIVYKTIKYRVAANNEKLYEFLKKLIENLKQTFDKKNKVFKAINKFFSFVFRINKNEIFNQFLIRFNNKTTFVKFVTFVKIKYFRNKLTKKIKFKMFYFKNCTN